jgi:hypothetical protein
VRGEAWFDAEYTQNKAPQVYKNLIANQPIEVSTGLGLSKSPALPRAAFKGRSYDWIATNYAPDHLAILPNEKGACSLKDGCGVFNSNLTQESTMNELIITNTWDEFFVENCKETGKPGPCKGFKKKGVAAPAQSVKTPKAAKAPKQSATMKTKTTKGNKDGYVEGKGYESKKTPGVFYQGKDDRDSDDKYIGKKQKKLGKEIKAIESEIEKVKALKQKNEDDHKATMAALDEMSKKLLTPKTTKAKTPVVPVKSTPKVIGPIAKGIADKAKNPGPDYSKMSIKIDKKSGKFIDKNTGKEVIVPEDPPKTGIKGPVAKAVKAQSEAHKAQMMKDWIEKNKDKAQTSEPKKAEPQGAKSNETMKPKEICSTRLERNIRQRSTDEEAQRFIRFW